MKLIISLVIVFSFIGYGQEYFNKKPSSLVELDNVLYVSSSEQLLSAVENYQTGDVIYLASKHFDVDLIITKDSLALIGSSMYGTHIKSIVVTGINYEFRNFSITDSLVIKSPSVDFNVNHKNVLENLNFNGADLYIGNDIASVRTRTFIKQCNFTNGTIYHFSPYQGIANFNSCVLQETGITIYGGEVRLDNSYAICGSKALTIDLKTGANFGYFNFRNSNNVEFDSFSYNLNGLNPWWLAFNIANCDRVWIKSTMTLGNDVAFEFNIFQSGFFMPNIVYNTTHPSRWEKVIQIGYNSTSTITGTGLANLYINHSTFKASAPGTLGANNYNVWNGYTDY